MKTCDLCGKYFDCQTNWFNLKYTSMKKYNKNGLDYVCNECYNHIMKYDIGKKIFNDVIFIKPEIEQMFLK